VLVPALKCYSCGATVCDEDLAARDDKCCSLIDDSLIDLRGLSVVGSVEATERCLLRSYSE
jgi:hypothetical protein